MSGERIDLTNPNYVKGLKSNMRAVFECPSGQEVLMFLDKLCGWYDFKEIDPNQILVNHGKRQVLASIKTILDQPSEVIVEIAKNGT